MLSFSSELQRSSDVGCDLAPCLLIHDFSFPPLGYCWEFYYIAMRAKRANLNGGLSKMFLTRAKMND
jgi:hypothetical protein